MAEIRLTEDERKALLNVLRGVEHVGVETGTWEQGRVLATVEAILAARLARVEALADMARRAVEQTETTCTCPDEPHQNLLHDLAHDLDAALSSGVCDMDANPTLNQCPRPECWSPVAHCRLAPVEPATEEADHG